jgi:hypothetical protein
MKLTDFVKRLGEFLEENPNVKAVHVEDSVELVLPTGADSFEIRKFFGEDSVIDLRNGSIYVEIPLD